MKKFNSWINENKKDFVKSVWDKRAPRLPNIDKEHYNEIPGMEGPFMLKSGKVVYYDPKKGEYYDRDSDMYMPIEDYMKHNESTMNQVVSGVKSDRKDLGPMAWETLQQLYDLLKNLAQTNPQKLMYITRIIEKELKNDPNANTKGILSGARRLINKSQNINNSNS